MKKNSGNLALIIVSVCAAIFDAIFLISWCFTGDPGGILSTILIVFGNLCLLIAWVLKIREQKKKK